MVDKEESIKRVKTIKDRNLENKVPKRSFFDNRFIENIIYHYK